MFSVWRAYPPVPRHTLFTGVPCSGKRKGGCKPQHMMLRSRSLPASHTSAAPFFFWKQYLAVLLSAVPSTTFLHSDVESRRVEGQSVYRHGVGAALTSNAPVTVFDLHTILMSYTPRDIVTEERMQSRWDSPWLNFLFGSGCRAGGIKLMNVAKVHPSSSVLSSTRMWRLSADWVTLVLIKHLTVSLLAEKHKKRQFIE